MSDDTLRAGPDDKPLPPELANALNARSEDDVAQQPSPGEIAAARRVDGPELHDQRRLEAGWPPLIDGGPAPAPAHVPMSQAPAAARTSAGNRLMSVLGPNFQTVLASMLLVGFKVVELTDAEKTQVQEQLLQVAREHQKGAALAKPNVLKMVPRRRIIRPGD